MVHEKNPTRKNSGQALVEYVLALALILGVFGIIDMSIRRAIGVVWKTMAKDIAPGCPGCQLPDELE